MTRSIALTALATSLLLAACSRGPAEDGNGQDASVTAVDANKTPTKDWNAMDACGVVDKAVMAALVG